MDRLTDHVHPLPNDTFCFCQICNTRGNDITGFTMWQECDESDNPIPGAYLIHCKSPECYKVVEEHPRLYMEVPWGQGEAGALMLLCGGCKLRTGNFACTSPKLIKNGGKGLTVMQTNSGITVHMCSHEDIVGDPEAEVPARSQRTSLFPSPFVECEDRQNMKGESAPKHGARDA